MIEATRDIVIALINNQSIANTGEFDENIKEVKNAIDEIMKQLQQSHDNRQAYKS